MDFEFKVQYEYISISFKSIARLHATPNPRIQEHSGRRRSRSRTRRRNWSLRTPPICVTQHVAHDAIHHNADDTISYATNRIKSTVRVTLELPARVSDLHWAHEAAARVAETRVLSARAAGAQHAARRVEVVPIGAQTLGVVRHRQLDLLQQVGAPVVLPARAAPADDSARAAGRDAERSRRHAGEPDV